MKKLFRHYTFNFTHCISLAHLHYVFFKFLANVYPNFQNIDKQIFCFGKKNTYFNFSFKVGNIMVENGGGAGLNRMKI